MSIRETIQFIGYSIKVTIKSIMRALTPKQDCFIKPRKEEKLK